MREGETDGRGTQLYIISIVMVVVTGFLVMARIAARLPKTRPSLGLDDYTIIVALVSQHEQFTEKYCRNRRLADNISCREWHRMRSYISRLWRTHCGSHKETKNRGPTGEHILCYLFVL